MSEDETMARLLRVTIGEIEDGDVVLEESDPAWADEFTTQAASIADALDIECDLHHVGSTAVADLPAKPTIDIVLVVDDPADESAYVPALESIGFELRLREPDWYEHRLLRRPTRTVHVHVFGPECPEVRRMLRFRDRLRADAGARHRYAQVKRQLAGRDWPTVQHYADAKGEIIRAILEDGADEEGRSTTPTG